MSRTLHGGIPWILLLVVGLPVSGQGLPATGWVPDDPEVVAKVPAQPLYRAFLPSKADLTRFMPPIKNQGDQGSCTAWATAYMAMSIAYNEAVSERLKGAPFPNLAFSPAYTYNLIHQGDCTGTSITAAFNTIRDHGLVRLEEFPYDPRTCATLPDPALRAPARTRRVLAYTRIDCRKEGALDKLRGALYGGRPVVIALNIDRKDEQAFDRYRGGIFTKQPASQDPHAMVLVGYDDESQCFLMANSWGPDWGEKGLMRIHYDAFFGDVADPTAYALEAIDPRGVKEIADGFAPPPPVPVPVPPPPPPVPVPVPVPPPPPPVPVPVPVPPPPGPITLISAEALAESIGKLPEASGCASVKAMVTGARVTLTGYVPSLAALSRAIQELKAPQGVSVDAGAVEELPWPQCEIRGDYRAPDSVQPGFGLKVGGIRDPKGVAGGTALQVSVSTPGVEAFLYVFYIQAHRDGNVVPLYQPLFDKMGKPRPSRLATSLNLNEPIPGIRKTFTVTAPFGPEAILLIASRAPLLPAAVVSGAWNERELLTHLRLNYHRLKAKGDILGVDTTFLTTIP